MKRDNTTQVSLGVQFSHPVGGTLKSGGGASKVWEEPGRPKGGTSLCKGG